MTEQKYAYQGYSKDDMARAIRKSLTISTKKSIETCSFIRGKTTKQARAALTRVLNFEDSIPYKRFNQELAHNQRGPGGYPIKVIQEMLKLIDDAEANAKSKGLNTEALKIIHICANRAGKRLRQGRQRQRRMKSTNLEIVLKESGAAKDKSTKKKPETKGTEKKAEKKEESQESQPKKASEPKTNAQPAVEKRSDAEVPSKDDNKNPEDKK